ncbi:MAG: 4Fe-4S binding protein [Oscillospiraceae bacterium]|nr:4Fe-4S binding protein [Oscillospiraceae bacterium]MCD8376822.1 4Fe-4S binding protein [Oscillospiraceae bacterium]
MIRDPLTITEQTPWQEMTTGGEIPQGGTARIIKTGEWRSDVPRWDSGKCKQCLLCTPFCPDASIPVLEGKRQDFDFDHCKGCGICAKVCPFGAIHMEKEGL